jgi:hypothetical protein
MKKLAARNYEDLLQVRGICVYDIYALLKQDYSVQFQSLMGCCQNRITKY